jgi:hypothetical protein
MSSKDSLSPQRCKDRKLRFEKHSKGLVKSTRNRRPLNSSNCKHAEGISSASFAVNLEREMRCVN